MVSLISKYYPSFASVNGSDGLGFLFFKSSAQLTSGIENSCKCLEPGQAPLSHDYSSLYHKDGPICELCLMGGSVSSRRDNAQIVMKNVIWMKSSGSRRMHLEWGIPGSSNSLRICDDWWWYAHLESGFEREFSENSGKMGTEISFAVVFYGGYNAIELIGIGLFRCFWIPKDGQSSRFISRFFDR